MSKSLLLIIIILALALVASFFFVGQKYWGKESVQISPQTQDQTEKSVTIKGEQEDTVSQKQYKLGLVYVYNRSDTRNPDWKREMESISNKVTRALKEVSNNRIDASIDILGEMKTDIFYWNPAVVGGKIKNIVIGGELYFKMPASDFLSSGLKVPPGVNQITESYCDNCIFKDDVYTVDREDLFTYANLWQSDKLNSLKQEVSRKLGVNFGYYEGIFIIFGRLGQVLPEDMVSLTYRCNTLSGVVGGYSNLIMAENSIRAGGFVPCDQVSRAPFYDKVGWHIMVHEILHQFGAVDIYDQGAVFGLDAQTEEHRRRALELDHQADESIMGRGVRDCMEETGRVKESRICTQEELERVYLDKYNRQLMGWE